MNKFCRYGGRELRNGTQQKNFGQVRPLQNYTLDNTKPLLIAVDFSATPASNIMYREVSPAVAESRHYRLQGPHQPNEEPEALGSQQIPWHLPIEKDRSRIAHAAGKSHSAKCELWAFAASWFIAQTTNALIWQELLAIDGRTIPVCLILKSHSSAKGAVPGAPISGRTSIGTKSQRRVALLKAARRAKFRGRHTSSPTKPLAQRHGRIET